MHVLKKLGFTRSRITNKQNVDVTSEVSSRRKPQSIATKKLQAVYIVKILAYETKSQGKLNIE
jgi:hypothetical protein